MSFGAGGILVLMAIFALGVLPTALTIWALVDAAGRPDWAWEYAGQNKTLWIVLLAVGLAVCMVGLVAMIIYFASIRPQVAAAQDADGYRG